VREGEVMESPDETLVPSRVSHGRADTSILHHYFVP
jgi:hypothetical protein